MKFIIAALLTFASLHGHAGERVDRIPPQHALYVAGEPGQSLDAFAGLVAPIVMRKSNELGAELCGEVRMDEDGTYAIDFYTINAFKACSYMRGPNSIGVTIHTHITVGQASGIPSSARMHMPRFSAADHDSPGYLVQGRRVAAQDGRIVSSW